MRADRGAVLRKNQYSGKRWTLSMRPSLHANKGIRGSLRFVEHVQNDVPYAY